MRALTDLLYNHTKVLQTCVNDCKQAGNTIVFDNTPHKAPERPWTNTTERILTDDVLKSPPTHRLIQLFMFPCFQKFPKCPPLIRNGNNSWISSDNAQ
ncbi:hypothetical protein GDO78_012524 [Eleutherodactylus coqui]|uniref:Uncharacterized protein n=1 Tax=Eleutherodactylus coqui TaxID=57060 RepID=A0A8J6K2V5_ELECQ|nr:hypothetical protein GDO78_012524 [Eleutherodactylus coqui]